MLWFIFGILARRVAASLWSRWTKMHGPLQRARRLRLFMEEMGGLWVKTGQIIALRRDLFSDEFCNEIGRLQDRACGFPFHYARQTIEGDLGRPIEEIFSEFDEQPLAAASIGQAYRARLRSSGVEVVVKVRRPNIAQSFAADFRYLRTWIVILTWSRIAPEFSWNDMYWELERAMLEELDYRQEATSLRRMRKNLRRQKIYVPKVYSKYSSDKVLVMELVRGVYMSEFIRALASNPERVREWMKENQIDARRVGKRLLYSHYQQLFEDNLYHCDLHPGNILLNRKSRLTLIDFGSVGSSDGSHLAKNFHMFQAFATRDYQKIADLFLLMAPYLPDRDLTECKEKIVQLFREYEPLAQIKSLPYHQKSFGMVAGKVVPVLSGAGVPAGWEMLRSLRAQLTVDASLMALLPGINYTKMIQNYLAKMQRRQTKMLRKPAQLRSQLFRLTESLEMPAKLGENAYFEGEYLRRRALKYEGYLPKAAWIGRYVSLTVARVWGLVSIVAVLACVHQRFDILHVVRRTWFYHLIQALPTLEPSLWFLGALTALYIRHEFVQITHILEQPEPPIMGGARR